MGYAVPEHIAALTRLGPTIHHRQSFAPVRLRGLDAAHVDVGPDLLPL
jgi:ribonuclease HII